MTEQNTPVATVPADTRTLNVYYAQATFQKIGMPGMSGPPGVLSWSKSSDSLWLQQLDDQQQPTIQIFAVNAVQVEDANIEMNMLRFKINGQNYQLFVRVAGADAARIGGLATGTPGAGAAFATEVAVAHAAHISELRDMLIAHGSAKSPASFKKMLAYGAGFAFILLALSIGLVIAASK
jgi:hypothetical protein